MNELMKRPKQTELGLGIHDGFALLDLARGWLKQGNPVVALELLQQAINSTEAQRDRMLLAGILKELGRGKMMQSEWESSEAYYLEAQRIFLDNEQYKGAAECARNRANMYFQNGNYSDAEGLCRQALEWSSAINDYELRATILNTMAAISSANGDLAESIQVFRLCLADFRSAGNAIRQGYVHLNIGLTQTDLGQMNEAVESLNQSLAIALEEKDLNLVEVCYQNIAKCYLAQRETNLAQAVIRTARKILPGLNSKALENELDLLDSRILRALGDFERAESLLARTYTSAVENRMAALIADTLHEQGLLAGDQGRLELASAKMEAAANQYRLIGMDKKFTEAVKAIEHLRGRING